MRRSRAGVESPRGSAAASPAQIAAALEKRVDRPDGGRARDLGRPLEEAGRALRVGQHPADRLLGLGQDDADAGGRGAAARPTPRSPCARRSCASTPTSSARRPSRAAPARSCCCACSSARASSSGRRRRSRSSSSRRRHGLVFVDEVDKIRSQVGGQPNVAGIRAQEALLTLIENESVPFTLPEWAGGATIERGLERPALRLRRRLRGPLRRRLRPGHGRQGPGRAAGRSPSSTSPAARARSCSSRCATG